MQLQQARLSDMAREGLYTYARGLIALQQNDDTTAEQALTRAADLLPDRLFPVPGRPLLLAARQPPVRPALLPPRHPGGRRGRRDLGGAGHGAGRRRRRRRRPQLPAAGLPHAQRQPRHHPPARRPAEAPGPVRGLPAGPAPRQGRQPVQRPPAGRLRRRCSRDVARVPDAEAAFREAVTVGGDFPYGVARPGRDAPHPAPLRAGPGPSDRAWWPRAPPTSRPGWSWAASWPRWASPTRPSSALNEASPPPRVRGRRQASPWPTSA